MNLYDSLFNGKRKPLTAAEEAELERLEAEARAELDALTDEEKEARYEEMLRRNK